jgi:enoyl-CoA hydratase/carnithine racemase
MSIDTIVFRMQDHIATVTMNRPEVLNALNDQLIEKLRATMREVVQDDKVRVMVLIGAGRGFCAGQDARAMPSGGGEPLVPYGTGRGDPMRHTRHTPRAMRWFSKAKGDSLDLKLLLTSWQTPCLRTRSPEKSLSRCSAVVT